MDQRIYLDISRLLLAARRRTPSGIERVELVYAKEFGQFESTVFVASLVGRLHRIPRIYALQFVSALEKKWQTSCNVGWKTPIIYMILIDILLLVKTIAFFLYEPRMTRDKSAAYINLSHENLANRSAIIRFSRRTNARLIFFVHDLIPISHPEYVRPGQAAVHRRRIDTVADLANAVIVNTLSTKNELLYYLRFKLAAPAVHVAHLGIPVDTAAPKHLAMHEIERPYFVCLATIEPRKNHLLLLHLWRSFAADNLVAPRLIIVGRRGWENEMVLDMLDRCPSLSAVVEERRGVRDEELEVLLSGATALLLPSFAEGYGLPVAEALNLGTPVICSDLPALREVGGDVPEYLDPLDGQAGGSRYWITQPRNHRAALRNAPASCPGPLQVGQPILTSCAASLTH